MLKPKTQHWQLSSFFLLVLLSGFVLSMGLSACTNDQVITSSYQTLLIASDTYDGAMQSAANLYSNGLIDEQTRDSVIDAGHKFQVAHQAASLALDAYASAVGRDDQGAMVTGKLNLDAAIGQLSRLLGELTALVSQHRPQA